MTKLIEFELFKPTRDYKYHSHKCPNCGTEWAHADICSFMPEPEFNKAHDCPNCGTHQTFKNQYPITEAEAKEINDAITGLQHHGTDQAEQGSA